MNSSSEKDLGVDLDEVVRALIRSTRATGDGRVLLSEVLTAAIRITNADRGTLQVLQAGALKIEGQIGFDKPFLDYFNIVQDATCVCGTALQAGRRIVVDDVASSPVFGEAPDRKVILQAGVGAVQSTPLMDSHGKTIGMLSTHYRTARKFSEHEFQRLDLLADLTAALIQRARLSA